MTSDREPVRRYGNALASIAVWLSVLCLCLVQDSRPCAAQLQITEVMFSPMDDAVWEWVEVRNTDLLNPIDLDGAYLDRLDDPRILGGAAPNIDAGLANNTIVPAGGTAILYNGQAPGIPSLAASDQVFHDAWNLDPNNTPLIAVSNFPSFPNSGSSLGIWSSFANYEADLVESTPGQFVVGSFDNSLAGLDFRGNFPTPNNGASIYWNGAGSDQDGLNWTASVGGTFSAHTSTSAAVGSGSINSSDDLANPGIIPNNPFGGGIIITEMMIDPASTEPDWEWIEIYNGGSAIDFSTTGYVFDDNDGNDLSAANITSGTVGNGEVAVLFNGDAITKQNMIDAWGGGDPNAVNFIEVTNFPSLENGTDRIGIWSSFSDYQTDSLPIPDPGRVFSLTEATLLYDGLWPTSPFGRHSIYLIDLDLDYDDGFNWEVSDPNFVDDPNSFSASAVSGGIEVHAGGDIGSPGFVDPTTVPNDADFDGDGIVSGLDFLIWQQGLQNGTTNATGDTNSDVMVNGVDLAVWESQYPSTTLDATSPDVNGDGRVDGLDFLAWQTGLGNTTLPEWEALYGTTFQAASLATVPEPTIGTLVCVLTTFSGQYRRRVFYSLQ